MILDGCFWLRLFRTESSSLSQVPGVSAPVEMVGLQGEKKIEKNRTPINILVKKMGVLYFLIATKRPAQAKRSRACCVCCYLFQLLVNHRGTEYTEFSFSKKVFSLCPLCLCGEKK